MSQCHFSFYDGLVTFAAITLWSYVPAGTMKMSDCVCAQLLLALRHVKKYSTPLVEYCVTI